MKMRHSQQLRARRPANGRGSKNDGVKRKRHLHGILASKQQV